MAKRKSKSLLSKVIIEISLAILLIGVLLMIPSVYFYHRELLQNQRDFTKLFAAVILQRCRTESGMRLNRDALGNFQEELKLLREREGLKAFVFENPVALVAASPSDERDLRLAAEAARSYGKSGARGLAFHEGEREIILSLPIRGSGGKRLGTLVVFRGLGELRSKLLNYVLMRLGLTLIGLLFLGVTVILVLYVVILKPLGTMIQANIAIYEGREDEALIPEAHIPPNEVGDIMRSRNQIYEKLLGYQKRIREQNKVLLAQQRELRRWSRELEKRIAEKSEELIRTHQRLAQSEKLAAMGKLAAGVAHEINNPLASIAGYAEDLRELARAKKLKLTKEFSEFPESLKIIEEQAYRCKAIIKKLLSFAREMEVRWEEVDLNGLIRETIPLVDYRLSGKPDVRLDFDLSPKLPRIQSDWGKLQQVLVNLLENAFDAVENRGSVVIRTEASERSVEVRVEDDGAGIPEENRDRIFDPFFTTKPVGEGTGLGLSICYGLVSELRGKIDFETRKGEGTTFRLSLPREVLGSRTIPSRGDSDGSEAPAGKPEPRSGEPAAPESKADPLAIPKP
jgi:signal transduction histidine kinase